MVRILNQEKKLINDFFFDTDCISAFLWVRNENILTQLYPGKIILPKQVYDEIKKVPHLFARIETLKNNGDLKIESIMQDTNEATLYTQMIGGTEAVLPIGRGEAACIAMAKERGGILASNNLRDINYYVSNYKIPHLTTGDILKEALNKKLITQEEGETIWGNMLSKRRKLGYDSFAAYLTANP